MLCGEIIGVFGVGFKGKIVGFWNVTEYALSQDVAPRLIADRVIAIIGTRNGDLGEGVIAGRCIF